MFAQVQSGPGAGLCRLLGCRYPILQSGMGGVARAELVAAVVEAGGYGFLGMVRESAELIAAEIHAVRERTDYAFGVNLIPFATDAALLDEELTACLEANVDSICFFWSVRADLIARVKAHGTRVLQQVGNVADARHAVAAGADVVIAQGFEAGGHVHGSVTSLVLLPQVVAAVDAPVVASGGFGRGDSLVAAWALGAQGILCGSAFVATTESFAHECHKASIVDASSEEALYTDVFARNWPVGAPTRVLANRVTQALGSRLIGNDPYELEPVAIGEDEGRPILLHSTDSPLRTTTGDLELMPHFAGQIAGRIGAVMSAGELVASIMHEADAVLRRLSAKAPRATTAAASAEEGEGAPGFASPPCFAHELEPTPLARAELVTWLNELLEGERAGARGLSELAKRESGATADLLREVARDEGRFCVMLRRHIARLDGEPSRKTGVFYEKLLAKPTLDAQMSLVDRGQGAVARSIAERLPRIIDTELAADLAEMLAVHETNIARCAPLTPGKRDEPRNER